MKTKRAISSSVTEGRCDGRRTCTTGRCCGFMGHVARSRPTRAAINLFPSFSLLSVFPVPLGRRVRPGLTLHAHRCVDAPVASRAAAAQHAFAFFFLPCQLDGWGEDVACTRRCLRSPTCTAPGALRSTRAQGRASFFLFFSLLCAQPAQASRACWRTVAGHNKECGVHRDVFRG